MISLYATYFSDKRVMAVSLASCGAATGGMIFPVVAYKCFDSIGFAWTVRVMTAIILANSVVIIKFTRSRIVPRSMPPWVDLSAFRERPYLLFSIGSFLIFEGIYFAYIYVSLTYLGRYVANATYRSDNMPRLILGLARASHSSF
jgi:MFS family permease